MQMIHSYNYISRDNNKASVMQVMKSLEDCTADISQWMGCNSLKINEDRQSLLFSVATLINIET